MKKFIKIFAAVVVGVFFPQQIMAGEFTCGTASGVPYCQYIGKITQTYANKDNGILFYFEGSMSPSLATDAGITGVTNGTAAVYNTTYNADFAKFLYSTALTAQTTNRDVAMQFKGSYSGYLLVEKIWLR